MKRDRIKELTIDGRVYLWDRRIFQIAIMILTILYAILILVYGVKPHFYYKCPDNAINGNCINPFYKDCSLNAFNACYDYKILPSEYESLKEIETLPAGFSLGAKPSFFVTYFLDLFVATIIISLFINHFVYNRDFKKRKRIKDL